MREKIEDCDVVFCREVCTCWSKSHERCKRLSVAICAIPDGYCLWEVDAKLDSINSERHRLKAGLGEYARKLEAM